MLSAVFNIIAIQKKHQDRHQVDLSGTQLAVMKALETKPLSCKEIFAAIEMNSNSRSFKRHIDPRLIQYLSAFLTQVFLLAFRYRIGNVHYPAIVNPQ
jgi:hypothetical protein